MDTRPVDPHSETAPSRQLVEQVLDALARGDLVAGERLPSVRSCAALALVNPNTVGRAYRELETLGVTEGRNGSGVYVTGKGPDRARKLRRTATLDAFRVAAREALGAGHDGKSLTTLLEQLCSGANGRRKVKS